MENSSSQRVLLTGATGRVGRAILPMLRERFTVRCFDKQSADDIPDLMVGDLTDPATLREAMNGIDTVIHLAAQSTEADFVSVLVPNNVVGLYNTFEAVKEAGVRRLIFASTIQAMGRHPQGYTITETDLPRPTTLYGATKAFGETMARWYHDTHGIEFLIVRIGWYLNPEDPKDLELIRAGRGANHIWLSARDAARLFTLAVTAPTIGEDGYGIVHATSRTRVERLSLEPARRLLGYEPMDNVADYQE